MKLWCVQCNKKVESDLTSGDVIYPHRPDLSNKNFYRCPQCKNYVGCHPNTINPLGCIPTEELKRARIIVHRKLDALWKSGKYKRSDIYKLLSNHFGYNYHNGNTKTVAECEKAMQILEELKYDKTREERR